MAKRALAKDNDKFIVRLPEGMRNRIAEAAEQRGHSMNAEVVNRLEQSFDPLLKDKQLAERAAELDRSDRNLEIQGIMIESLTRENEALKKAGMATENLLLIIAGALHSAASGDDAELKGLLAREKSDPTFGRIKTVWSVVRDD